MFWFFIRKLIHETWQHLHVPHLVSQQWIQGPCTSASPMYVTESIIHLHTWIPQDTSMIMIDIYNIVTGILIFSYHFNSYITRLVDTLTSVLCYLRKYHMDEKKLHWLVEHLLSPLISTERRKLMGNSEAQDFMLQFQGKRGHQICSLDYESNSTTQSWF